MLIESILRLIVYLSLLIFSISPLIISIVFFSLGTKNLIIYGHLKEKKFLYKSLLFSFIGFSFFMIIFLGSLFAVHSFRFFRLSSLIYLLPGLLFLYDYPQGFKGIVVFLARLFVSFSPILLSFLSYFHAKQIEKENNFDESRFFNRVLFFKKIFPVLLVVFFIFMHLHLFYYAFKKIFSFLFN